MKLFVLLLTVLPTLAVGAATTPTRSPAARSMSINPDHVQTPKSPRAYPPAPAPRAVLTNGERLARGMAPKKPRLTSSTREGERSAGHNRGLVVYPDTLPQLNAHHHRRWRECFMAPSTHHALNSCSQLLWQDPGQRRRRHYVRVHFSDVERVRGVRPRSIVRSLDCLCLSSTLSDYAYADPQTVRSSCRSPPPTALLRSTCSLRFVNLLLLPLPDAHIFLAERTVSDIPVHGPYEWLREHKLQHWLWLV